MRELQQELQKYDIPVIIPEQQGHTAQYRYDSLELRDKLFGSVNKIKNLADITNINTAANDSTEKEFTQYRQAIYHLQVCLFKVCIILLEIDDEFPLVLKKTEKYLTSLETVIPPYFNYNNTKKIEPLHVYHQRLKNYKAELDKYEAMVLSGTENASAAHTALSMAFFIKNILDIETAGESEISDYFTTLKRLEHFENVQLQHLDKIIQLKIKINNILNHSPIVTLSKILVEQRTDPPVKKILITVSFTLKE